jgi:hypothetical protein
LGEALISEKKRRWAGEMILDQQHARRDRWRREKRKKKRKKKDWRFILERRNSTPLMLMVKG